MEQYKLTPPRPLSMSLGEVLGKRTSKRIANAKLIEMEVFSDLFGHALMKRTGEGVVSRPYPSGGALFPIETYLIAEGVNDERSAFHYNPSTHSLERLCVAPNAISEYLIDCDWAHAAPAMIVMTSVWAHNWNKYSDFGYYLALIEAGHIGQNIVLVATALGLSACPLGGFNDVLIAELLDIDTSQEQVVYAIPVFYS